MERIFPGDTYETPADTPRFLGDRLACGTSLYFNLLFGRLVVRNARLARRGLYPDEAWVRSSLHSLRDLEGCGARFHIQGLDNFRHVEPPVLFISNHMSILETFVFPCLIQPDLHLTFVVKDTLVNHPFFGPVMRSRDPVIVRRRNPREDLEAVLKGGAERLRRGISLVVFPQATRSAWFDPASFNTLGLKLAKRADVPFVPVAIKTDFWANGRLLKDLGPLRRERPVHIRFGLPERVRGNGSEQHQEMVRFIEQQLAEWGHRPSRE
jgi:1-acyl-sn-glycerol-3-phosphate acyltransferase